jgi:hypothetical protein
VLRLVDSDTGLDRDLPVGVSAFDGRPGFPLGTRAERHNIGRPDAWLRCVRSSFGIPAERIPDDWVLAAVHRADGFEQRFPG